MIEYVVLTIVCIVLILLIVVLVRVYQLPTGPSITIEEPFTNSEHAEDKLVLYYTEWCPHCQRIMPLWKEFVKNNKTGVKTMAFDCEQNRSRCHDAKICGYPTIVLYKANGDKIKFNGEKTLQAINNFVNANLATKMSAHSART
jgi:thiol-disulfide isomerase/thioredoxin